MLCYVCYVYMVDYLRTAKHSLSQWSVQELLKNCLFCNRYFELKTFAAVKVSGEKGVDEVQDKLLSNYVPPKQCELVPA